MIPHGMVLPTEYPCPSLEEARHLLASERLSRHPLEPCLIFLSQPAVASVGLLPYGSKSGSIGMNLYF